MLAYEIVIVHPYAIYFFNNYKSLYIFVFFLTVICHQYESLDRNKSFINIIQQYSCFSYYNSKFVGEKMLRKIQLCQYMSILSVFVQVLQIY